MLGIIKIGTMFVIVALTLGCAESRHIIQQKQSVERSNVFKEYMSGDIIPSSMSLLSISSSFKTHRDDFYILESGKSPHGKPYYNILVNIDGQPIKWKIEGKLETSSIYDESGKRSRDPEAGNGVRYTLEKKLIISPGRHKVFFSLPDDEYYIEFSIIVLKGDENFLDLKPVYNSLRRPGTFRSFLSGIKDFKATYNGVCCVSE